MIAFLIALTFYAIGFTMIWRRLGQANAEPQSAPLFAAIPGLISHGGLLVMDAITASTLNLALGNVVSLVCFVSVGIWLLAAISNRVASLGILVLPVGAVGLTLGHFFSGPPQILADPPVFLLLHLTIALLGFAILCVATAQAALLYLQEGQLRKRNPLGLFPALPPLEIMQKNLLGLIRIGAVFLTINLMTGSISHYQVHGSVLGFNHHILLSVIAWLAYVALLMGNKIYGWRGKIAAKWTMFAFVVLILAYFGTRFVTSVLLG